MFKIVDESPTRLEKEFEAVKGLAKNNFNDFFILVSYIALFSLLVLVTCITGKSITFAVATLVVIIGLFFVLFILGECNLIYPLRFRILYKKSCSSKR